MDNEHASVKHFSKIETLLVVITFLICLVGAMIIPVEQCPDEWARRLLSDWMVNNGTLPTGNEPETLIMEYGAWGFSYALRPFLSSIIGAVFERASAAFKLPEMMITAASRMCSVISNTLCCIFSLKIGHKLFRKRSSAILLAVFVCFLPQVMFIGMYQNNDSLSLAAVCIMLYYFADGYDSAWSVKSCIGLGIGFSLGLLSYYTIYGWILICLIACIASVLTDSNLTCKYGLVLKRGVLIFCICFVLAGWFFIRNAILHQGDFLGIASEEASREALISKGIKLIEYDSAFEKGYSIRQFITSGDFYWFRTAAKSFIGVFGYMYLYLPFYQYLLYYAVLLLALIFFMIALFYEKPCKRDKTIILVMTASCWVTFLLFFFHSYFRDYQPQGRYIITIAILFGYMTAYSLESFDLKFTFKNKAGTVILDFETIITILWFILAFCVIFGTMIKMIY